MSCRDPISWKANVVIDDIHAYLYDRSWDPNCPKVRKIPFIIFRMFDVAFVRACLLFGGEQAYWLIDNLDWPPTD